MGSAGRHVLLAQVLSSVLTRLNLFCLWQEDCVCAQMREQARTQALDRLNADVVDVADVADV